MRHHYRYAALAAAMMMAYGTANAQSTPSGERTEEFSRSLSYADYLKGENLRASQLVGSRVRNAQGDSLGEIEELVIPSRDQDDMLVILSVGGLLDVGDKLVALPYDDLRISADGDTFYYDRSEEQLKAAPAFTYDARPELQARSDRQVDRDTQPAPVAAARTTTTDAPRAAAPRTAPARATAEQPRTTPTVTAVTKSGNVTLDVFDHRASDLIGATVLDYRGESVGKVDDIVVSTEDDKLHVIVAIGGFAGFGEKLISLPFDDLQITSDDDNPQVRISMTGEELQQLVETRTEFRYERQLAQTPAAAPRG